MKKLRRASSFLKQTLIGLRSLHADRDRLARVEQTLEGERERIQQQHVQLEESIKHTFDMRLQSERESVQKQHLRLEDGIKNTFDVMGQNRIADHNTVAAIRTELLEALVRSRLALGLRLDSSESLAPLMRPPLPIEEARRKLAAAAPSNWKMYVDCLGRGTDSYKSFPPGSCSTAAHAEADLFRAFLRPYLRGSRAHLPTIPTMGLSRSRTIRNTFITSTALGCCH